MTEQQPKKTLAERAAFAEGRFQGYRDVAEWLCSRYGHIGDIAASIRLGAAVPGQEKESGG